MMEKLSGLYRQYQELKKRFKSLDTSKDDPADIKSTADALAAVESLLEKETEKKKQRKLEKETKEKASTEEVKVEATPEPAPVSDMPPMNHPPAKDAPGEFDPMSQHKCRGCGKVEDGPTWGVAWCKTCWDGWKKDTKSSIEASNDKFALDTEVEPVRGQPGSWGKVMRHDGPGSLVYVRWEDGPLKKREEFGGYYHSDLKKKAGPAPENPVNQQNLTDYIMQFEDGSLDQDGVLALFQYLVDTGMAWSLQGSYGRAAKALIEQGLINAPKDRLYPGIKPPTVEELESKKAEPSGVGYGGDRPGIAVAPKRDEDVSLNATTDKQSAKINVFQREWEVIPKYKDGLVDFQGYTIMDDAGRKIMDINTKQQMSKEQLEYAVGTEMMKASRTATLLQDLAFLKKGSVVRVLEVKENRVRFASLDNSLRGSAPLKKFAARLVAHDLKHGDHIDDALGSTAEGESLVECPKGSGKMRWVNQRELLPTQQPPATPESLNEEAADHMVCGSCGNKLSGNSYVHSETVKGGRKLFCNDGCKDKFLKTLNAAGPSGNHGEGDCPRCGTNPKPGPEMCDLCKQHVRELDKAIPPRTASINKSAVVTERSDGWHVLSEEGKNLGGPYKSKEQAVKRLRQVEYFKHKKGSKRPLSKKEAEQTLSLDEHIQVMRDRMNSVRERLQTSPVPKQADEHPIETPAVQDMVQDLEMGIDLLENIYRDKPDVIQHLEELENILYSVEDQVGLHHELPAHEQAEPIHQEHVDEEPAKEASVEKAADDINSPPTTPPPQGMKYVWDDDKKRWMLIKKVGL